MLEKVLVVVCEMACVLARLHAGMEPAILYVGVVRLLAIVGLGYELVGERASIGLNTTIIKLITTGATIRSGGEDNGYSWSCTEPQTSRT